MTEFPQMDSGLAVPVFTQGDDPVAYVNKAIDFMTALASSKFPSMYEWGLVDGVVGRLGWRGCVVLLGCWVGVEGLQMDKNDEIGVKNEYSSLYTSCGEEIGMKTEGAFCTQRKVSMVSFGRISPNSFPFFYGVPIRLLALAMAAVCASKAAVKSAVSCRMASKVMAGVLDVEDELDNVVKEEDEEQICFLGGNSSSGTKKYQGSNSSDGGNIGDGVKIAGEVIGFGDEIEFSEELKELLPDEVGK
ncbi:hypothetical protein Tco_0150108 [Tanacetum coccineum]